MDIKFKKLKLVSALLIGLPLVGGSAVYAAKPINLTHQPVSSFQSLVSPSATTSMMTIKEISRNLDFKKTMHILYYLYLNKTPRQVHIYRFF